MIVIAEFCPELRIGYCIKMHSKGRSLTQVPARKLEGAAMRVPLRVQVRRGRVVVPKGILDLMGLKEGDQLDLTAKRGQVLMKLQLSDDPEALTRQEAAKVRLGLKDVRDGKTKPWSQIKREMGL